MIVRQIHIQSSHTIQNTHTCCYALRKPIGYRHGGLLFARFRVIERYSARQKTAGSTGGYDQGTVEVAVGMAPAEGARGMWLMRRAMASRSAWVEMDRSVLFANQRRTSPLQFSLTGRCQGAWGSAKLVGVPRTCSMSAHSAISALIPGEGVPACLGDRAKQPYNTRRRRRCVIAVG